MFHAGVPLGDLNFSKVTDECIHDVISLRNYLLHQEIECISLKTWWKQNAKVAPLFGSEVRLSKTILRLWGVFWVTTQRKCFWPLTDLMSMRLYLVSENCFSWVAPKIFHKEPPDSYILHTYLLPVHINIGYQNFVLRSLITSDYRKTKKRGIVRSYENSRTTYFRILQN